MDWISIKDRMPDIEDEYLVADSKIVSTLEFRNKKWYSDSLDVYIPKGRITHWMPLPKPPNK